MQQAPSLHAITWCHFLFGATLMNISSLTLELKRKLRHWHPAQSCECSTEVISHMLGEKRVWRGPQQQILHSVSTSGVGLCLLSYDSWTCFVVEEHGNCSHSPWTWRWILWLFAVRQMTRLLLVPQHRHPPAAPLTQPSRVDWAAWAMDSGWRGTTWGRLSRSSSSAAWFWPSSTSCRPLFMEDPSKTHCFLWSSMSVGPGLLQTSRTPQDQPRCLEISPPHTWRKWLLNSTETMRQSKECLETSRIMSCLPWIILVWEIFIF